MPRLCSECISHCLWFSPLPSSVLPYCLLSLYGPVLGLELTCALDLEWPVQVWRHSSATQDVCYFLVRLEPNRPGWSRWVWLKVSSCCHCLSLSRCSVKPSWDLAQVLTPHKQKLTWTCFFLDVRHQLDYSHWFHLHLSHCSDNTCRHTPERDERNRWWAEVQAKIKSRKFG